VRACEWVGKVGACVCVCVCVCKRERENRKRGRVQTFARE
jgi:hypothetical protein